MAEITFLDNNAVCVIGKIKSDWYNHLILLNDKWYSFKEWYQEGLSDGRMKVVYFDVFLKENE